MRNNITRVFFLTLGLLLVLLALSFLPQWKVGDHEMQQVDLLSDVRKDTLTDLEAELTEEVLKDIVPDNADSCKAGVTCIEDFGKGEVNNMDHFYAALVRAAKGEGCARIAFLGDSFIEGDILTADLRRMLQEKFGGSGVGYVNIHSVDESFRATLKRKTTGFDMFSARDEHYNFSKSGISGYYFTASRGATLFLSGRDDYNKTQSYAESATLYFSADGNATVSAQINGSTPATVSYSASGGVKSARVEGKIATIRWTVDNVSPGTAFYGAALDNLRGVSVDNLPLRGSAGFHIAEFPRQMLEGFDAERHYDLIVLQYGLNVASKNQRDYSTYTKRFVEGVRLLRECFPQTSILILSVGDRDYNSSGGQLRTMPGVISLVVYQRKAAAEEKVAFWNTFEAMGGEGSMARWAQQQLPAANKDYTHINFVGGKQLAKKLFDAFSWGLQLYEERHKNKD